MCLAIDISKNQKDYYEDYTMERIDGIEYLLAIKIFSFDKNTGTLKGEYQTKFKYKLQKCKHGLQSLSSDKAQKVCLVSDFSNNELPFSYSTKKLGYHCLQHFYYGLLMYDKIDDTMFFISPILINKNDIQFFGRGGDVTCESFIIPAPDILEKILFHYRYYSYSEKEKYNYSEIYNKLKVI